MVLIPAALASEVDGKLYRSILHTLDYLAVDYPASVRDGKVIDEGEYKEQQEMVRNLGDQFRRLPEGSEKTGMLVALTALQRSIDERHPPVEVQADSRALAAAILAAYPVEAAPRKIPDLKNISVLYQEHCSGCHGATGYGDGAMAAGLEPAPANFHDQDRQRQLNVFGLFNTITLGVEGTAMKAFTDLSDEQRWALAFYVSNFLFAGEPDDIGRAIWLDGEFTDRLPDLASLVLTSPHTASVRWGDDGVEVLSFLRRNPEALDMTGASPLAVTRQYLSESMTLYHDGKAGPAYEKALAAYLDGFELVEKHLNSSAPQLRRDIETAMRNYRNGIKDGAALELVEKDFDTANDLLGQAQDALGSEASGWATFLTSFLILLREGVEAILVLAAIYALLVQAGQRAALRYIHAGWVGALLLGILTWFIASRFIQVGGANREITEGLVALVTAAMLLYVGFWLHNKANSRQWQQYIREQITHRIGQGALWGLTIIAFLAVYREVFETVLFYQSLWLQESGEGQNAIVTGGLSAVVLLVLIAWGVFRYSVRLPVRLFFQANAVILFVLALIFTGKGVAALQEAGTIPVNPVTFPEIDLLGIYPNAESLGLQLVVIVVAAGWLIYGRMRDTRTAS